MITKTELSWLGRLFLILVLIMMELGGMPVQQVSAATLTVTNTNDSGPGSLRQAIADAVSGDVITFDPSLAGATITLGSDLSVTSKDISIDGSGLSPQVTVSGGDVAHLVFSTSTTITISNLVITHGLGSGIVSGGSLTVLNSTLKNNHTTGGGGGINSSGTLTVKNSTIAQNQAGSGGGIAIQGNQNNQIFNSTITGNQATDGGGIYIAGIAFVDIHNTTFAGNLASQGAEVKMIGSAAALNAINTIFACAPTNTNCYQYSGQNIGLTNSILGVGTLHDYGLAALADNGGPTPTMALLPGSSLIDAGNDASCEATDQRGVTRPKGTHCDIGAYEDQTIVRYVKQNAGGLNDGTSWANAYNDLQTALAVTFPDEEIWVAAGTYMPTATTDRTISFNLHNAVALYGGFAGGETALGQRDPAAHPTILSGDIGTLNDNSDNSYHIVVGSGTNNSAILDGFTVSGGNANGSSSAGQGGGMYNYQGSPTVGNVIFLNNAATFGGGMYNGGDSSLMTNGSFPILTNVTFDGNTATEGGGMENQYKSSPTLNTVTFKNNSAIRSGGGMLNFEQSNPSLTGVTFTNNIGGWGGGMANWMNNQPVLNNVSFTANSAERGGGMGNYNSSPSLLNVSFNNNTVTGNSGNPESGAGGGMSNDSDSHPILTNVTFTGNTASSNVVSTHGGGVYNNASSPSLTDVTFTGNSAGAGGGMSNWQGSQPTLERVTFTGNSAENGGGMGNDASSPSLHNVTFENNTVTIYGGGMSNDNQSSPSLTNVTFSGNKAYLASAETYGGGMTNEQSSAPTLTNVTFYNNSATHGGGMLNRDPGSAPVITNATFNGNTAAVEGGAIANDGNMIVRNGIFWGNNGGEIFNLDNATPLVTYSIVQGGYTGTGNLNSDPLLGSLTNNGGFTKTMAIGAISPAIDAGDDAHCTSPDQRGVTRPQRTHCDIGAYEYEDLTPPTVLSIVRADPSPTSASTVHFTVTFSEKVINVESGDFSLATTGVTGAVITNISGSGASYTVTVSTGSGNGTIHLDLVDDDSIKDLANLPLGGAGAGNGSFTSGETYTIAWITIAGNAGAANVTLSYTDGTPRTAVTDGSGNYSFLVSYNWSGTVTPSKTGFTFSPGSKSYTSLTSNRTSENYTATPVTYTISGNANVAGAILSYTDGTAKTTTADGSGNYSFTVSYNWSGTVTPSKAGFTFSPISKTYTDVTSNQVSQNYTAIPITYMISGNAGMGGVVLNYTDGTSKTTTADGSGNYSFTVSYNWSGTVTPSKTGYTFSPASKAYSNVLADQTAQNYTATAITYVISGSAGTAGVTLSYNDGVPKSVVTDASGNYSFTVSYNWSGTVTPSKTGFTFSPASRSYTNVLGDKPGQNYSIPVPSASFDAWPININVGSSTEFHIVSTLNTTSCAWDYGDGSQRVAACESYHTHPYTTPGFYTVSLTATGPSGTNSMTRTRYITVFPTLVINPTGDGTGTVTSNPAGINCGTDCSGDFPYQTSVTLTAVASPGSSFLGWSGGGCSGTAPCTVTVNTALTVSAYFEKIVASCPTITDWRGEYWVNSSLSGSPVLCRNDASLTFNWGSGSPDPSIPADNFSAQWTRTVNFSGGRYQFYIDHDDGARLYIDDMVHPALDKWGTCCDVDTSDPILLSDGNHVVRMQYYEGGGAANARLWWVKLNPAVISITRVDPNPTVASSVHFNVFFSESVSNVDVNDFSLTTSGITGASVTGVTGSGITRVIAVNTGRGNGTIRLNLVDNDSIRNLANVPLGGVGMGNGNFTAGESYAVTEGASVTIGSQPSIASPVLPSLPATVAPANIVDGPVKVKSSRGVNLFTSERVISGDSFNEVMGYPTNQLTTEYWFPWYDNKDMSTWVLVGNASSTQTAAVDIYIGGIKRGSYNIPVNGRITPRFNLQTGPVRVVSTNGVKIFTSERTQYGSNNAFNEVMGYPASQFTTEYWFPWYDNNSMLTWILVGNPSTTSAAAVNIYIGGKKVGAYTIPKGGQITPRFIIPPTGPVRVVSTNGVKIFSSERTVYGDSFNEVMGYPKDQFTTEYFYPWYDNVNMSTWVLVGNPSTTTSANVDIYVGNVKQGSYSIKPGKQINQRFSLNTGPVRVVSTNGVKIFSSERVLYSTSFNEVMGYPGDRLSAEYWFPWYDSTSMSTNILVGTP